MPLLSFYSVPGPGDGAYISISGTYSVTVENDQTVTSVDVGAGTSSITFLIRSNVHLNVTKQVTCVAPTMSVLGKLTVKTFLWNGLNLIGSSGSPGQIVVTDLMKVSLGSYNSKYLRHTVITALKNFTMDSTTDSSRYYMYCDSCRVVVEKNATFRTGNVRWVRTGSEPPVDPVDGFRIGFVNYGTFVIECMSSSSIYHYLDMRNYGRVIFVTMRWQSVYYIYLQNGVWINTGSFDMYSVYLQVRYGARISGNGSMTVYGLPSRPTAPPSSGKPQHWRSYIQELFDNSTRTFNGKPLYNPSYLSVLQISNAYSNTVPLEVNSLTTYGSYSLQISSSSNIQMKLGSLQMDSSGRVETTSSSNRNNTLLLGERSNSIISLYLAPNQLMLATGNDANITFLRSVFLVGGSHIQFGKRNLIVFQDDVEVDGSSSISTGDSTSLTFSRDLRLSGALNISRSKAHINGKLDWTEGTIGGNSSTLYLNRDNKISGSRQKTLRGVGLDLQLRQEPAAGRCFVEYFQYRVKGPTTPLISSSIYYFPTESTSSSRLPDSFDNATSVPTLTRTEAGVQHVARYYGHGPLRFMATSSSSATIDLTSPYTFTYKYAVRKWFYLQIDTPGQYTFYVRLGYSYKMRMRIDGQQILSRGYYSSYPPPEYPSSAIPLTAGMHVVQIDYIVTSSYWEARGGILLLSYSGPSITKTLIPDSKIASYTTNSGRIVYANNASYLNNANGKATLSVTGSGLLLAEAGSSLAVSASGVFQILSDVILLSYGLPADIFRISNAGEIRKDGTNGLAALYVNYNQLVGGKVTINTGSLEFRDLGRDGGLAIWNNPNGGRWTDTSNWIPAKLPSTTEVVYITQPGTYTITIPGNTNISVMTLVLGALGSNPSLQLGYFSNLEVLDKLDVLSQVLTINGRVSAKNIVWSGQKIIGSGLYSNLEATQSFALVWASYTSKTLDNVVVENRGNFSVDGSITGGSGTANARLYCGNCRIVNFPGANFVSTDMYTYKLYSTCSTSGSILCTSPGLVNYGALVVQLRGTASEWRIDVWNSGRAVFVQKNPGSNQQIRFYGGFYGSSGTLDIYMLQFSAYSSGYAAQLGRVRVFGVPVSSTSLQLARGANGFGQWQEYIADLYSGTVNYDLSQSSALLRFYRNTGRATNYRQVSLTSFESYGRTRFYVDGGAYLNISIAEYYRSDGNGELAIISTSTLPSKLMIGSKQQLSIDAFSLPSSWIAEFADNATIDFVKALILNSNASVVLGKNSTVNVRCPYFGNSGSSLKIFSGNMVFHNTIKSDGTLDFGSSRVHMLEKWSLGSGQVLGNLAFLTVNGGWDVFGSQDKLFRNVAINIQSPPQATSTDAAFSGVLVEYFQYRVKNDINPVMSSLYSYYTRGCSSCIPQNFDNADAAYNFVEIRNSINHFPTRYGFGPVQYISQFNSYNTTSPLSFLYNYGSRWWFFIDIPNTDTYVFYLRSGYSLRYRLWIDGRVVRTGSFYRTFYTSVEDQYSIKLTKGMHQFRLDEIIQSTYWDTRGNAFTMSWSSSTMPKQLVNDAVLIYKSNGTWAQPSYNSVGKNFVSRYHATFSGTGLILARDAVAVTIGSSSVFDVQSDSVWQCLSPTSCSFNNSGTLRRSGSMGPAFLYAGYIQQKSGSIDTQVSSLKIRSPSSSSTLLSWISATGGVWTNASNWASGRVPVSGDTVYINIPGNYTIVIPGGTYNVTTLVLGSSSSFPTIQVDHFCSLYVSQRIDVRKGSTLVIKGVVSTMDMFWGGDSIEGSTAAFATKQLIIRGTMIMQLGSNTRKYFKNLAIENYGRITEDASITGASLILYLYLQSSTLTNHRNATLELTHSYLYQASATGFVLVNYGTVIFYTPTGRSKYVYWDTWNLGDILYFPRSSGSSNTVYFYGSFRNEGNASSYNVNMRHYKFPTTPTQGGSWKVFGAPFVAHTTTFEIGKWREFLTNPYNMSTIYTYTNSYMQFNSLSNVVMRMSSLEVHGAYVRLFRCSNVTIDVSGPLTMGDSSRLEGEPCLRKPCAFNVMGNRTTQIRVGFVYLSQWNMTLSAGSVHFASGVSVLSESTLSISAPSVTTSASVAVASSAKITFMNASQVMVTADFSLSGGSVSLGQSTVTFQRRLLFSSGSFIGPGTVNIAGNAVLSSSVAKIFDSTTVNVNVAGISAQTNGALVEYFQYRVATSTTPRLSSIYSYFSSSSPSNSVPAAFDDLRSQPNVRRLEPSIQRTARYQGYGPFLLKPAATMYDFNSADTFSYNYAVRFLTFLRVPKTQLYSLYWRHGYSSRPRLWISGAIVATGSFYGRLYRGLRFVKNVTLNAGAVPLRLDSIVQSTYWDSSGNALELYWHSKDIPLQRIPDANFFPFTETLPSSTLKTVSPSVAITNLSPCSPAVDSAKFPLSFGRLTVKDNGVLQFQGKSALVVGRKGILDLQTSRSWPISTSGTRLNLTVDGLVTRSSGSGVLMLNTLLSISASGCVNSTSGQLDLGLNG